MEITMRHLWEEKAKSELSRVLVPVRARILWFVAGIS